MSEQKSDKFLNSSLKKKIIEFKYGKKDSCEAITSGGKRCKKSFKYRFEDEVKDCGSYCKSHCKDWIFDMLNDLINGDIIVNGIVEKRFKMKIVFGDGKYKFKFWYYNTLTIKEISQEMIIDDEYETKSVFGSKNDKLDNVIKYMGEILCKSNSDIVIDVDHVHKGSIDNLEIGGIRGWIVYPENFDEYIFSKTYNLSKY